MTIETNAATGTTELYLDLMANCLTRLAFPEKYRSIRRPANVWRRIVWALCYLPVEKALHTANLGLVKRQAVNTIHRTWGQDFPEDAETMIGMKRLRNIQYCVGRVLTDRIPGDLVETGVWRGGAAIFMRAILRAYGDTERRVWLADSFRGLPKPDGERYPADKGSVFWRYSAKLGVPVEEVKRNFRRYGLLDEQVCFLVGWFKDTLPAAPIDRIAVLRLDGDMYQSTMDALVNLYEKVSRGGFVIIDDYELPECRQAVSDFRKARGIADEIIAIDHTGVFWKKSS